jgi:hypothetical protein
MEHAIWDGKMSFQKAAATLDMPRGTFSAWVEEEWDAAIAYR